MAAVGCIDNGARRLFDDGERLHGGGAVHNLLDQQRELPQTDAAGDTFTAGLCVAQLQKGQRHIHGTRRGARGNPALDVAVELSTTVWARFWVLMSSLLKAFHSFCPPQRKRYRKGGLMLLLRMAQNFSDVNLLQISYFHNKFLQKQRESFTI